MPLRTVSNEAVRVMSLPLNTILPRRGGLNPTIEFTSVRLADAVAAEQAEDLPLLELERQALQHVGVAVIGMDVLNVEDRHDQSVPR